MRWKNWTQNTLALRYDLNIVACCAHTCRKCLHGCMQLVLDQTEWFAVLMRQYWLTRARYLLDNYYYCCLCDWNFNCSESIVVTFSFRSQNFGSSVKIPNAIFLAKSNDGEISSACLHCATKPKSMRWATNKLYIYFYFQLVFCANIFQRRHFLLNKEMYEQLSKWNEVVTPETSGDGEAAYDDLRFVHREH